MEYFRRFDEVVDTEDVDEGKGFEDLARDWRIRAAAAGPVALAPGVREEGVVRIALPAPPRPVEM